MDFFLEIQNGECGLGEHFCDHQRYHGPTQAEVSRSQQKPGRGKEQGECTLLITKWSCCCHGHPM